MNICAMYIKVLMNELERKRFLAKIARPYYLEGLTQQNIANKLNISRTKVPDILPGPGKKKSQR